MANDSEILEQGDIFFLYRPDVEEDHPQGLGDVQRFFIVLRPKKGRLRLLVVGRKRLPAVEEHERNWGFVDSLWGDAAALEKELRAEQYETKTRGTREQPAARPAGEGVYAITLKDGRCISSIRWSSPRGLARCRRRSASRRRRPTSSP